MEHLTKQQLILVALLVSFVTSMATGIFTVSLMEQAPDPVVQTINRVVERTVETVVQAPEKPNQQAAVITKETIIVKADDLVMQAVEKNTPNIVRISDETETVVALGLIVDGTIVVSSDALGVKATSSRPVPFEIRFFDTSTTTASVVAYDATSSIAVLKPNLKEGQKIGSAVLGNSDQLKLGQTIVMLGGVSSNSVKSGIIASLPTKEITLPVAPPEATAKKQTVLLGIETDIGSADIVGTVITNLSGEIIGISLDSGADRLAPISIVKTVLESGKKGREQTTTEQ